MRNYWWVLMAAVLAASQSGAQERRRLFGPRDCAPPQAGPCVPAPSGQPLAPGQQSPLDPNVPLNPADRPPTANSPFSEALASAGESGTQPAAGYMPGFFGDLLASCIGTPVFIPGQPPSGGRFTAICSPNVTQSGGIKVAESDSPRPTDRIYYLYNYYGNVQVNIPDPTAPLMQVNRHVLGFEKTLFGGDASIGMRLPFFSFGGNPAYETGFVGDLTIITKYALINNERTGNVLSGGLAFTVPSGGSPNLLVAPGVRAPQIRYYPVTFQPFAGYVVNPFDRLYFHGFHGVAVPTDSRDPTFMSNGVGLGYWLFRNTADQFIQGLVPTFEVHVNTPFNHRTAAVLGDTIMGDSVNLTMGFNLLLPRSIFGAAVGVPLNFGPHKIEAQASYSMRF